MKYTKIKYKGKILEVLTIGQLAEVVFRKPDTLRKMEEAEQLPMPNLRGKPAENGNLGKRLYTRQLANNLVPIFAKIQNGKKMSPELIREFYLAFQEEQKIINAPVP